MASPNSNANSNSNSTLTMDQLLNAQQNTAMIDAALMDIRRLLLQKEALQADVEALEREKAQLTGAVVVLRSGATGNSSSRNHEVHRASSSPDLCASSSQQQQANNNDTDNTSTYYDSDDIHSDESESPVRMTKEERLANAPQRFVCPLTLQVMKHPMKQKGTKKNYERGAIMEWIFFGKATCPLTRKKLHPGDFKPNLILRREIQHWRRMHGLMDEQSESDHLDNSSDLVVQTLTPEQERAQQNRLVRQISKGSENNLELMGLRDRILKNRDDRVRRRVSAGGL